MIPRRLLPIHLVALGAVAAAGTFLVAPFWPWIVLALWASGLAGKLLQPIVRLVKGRRRAAALITSGILVAGLLPILLVVVPLTIDAVALLRRMGEAGGTRTMLEALVAPTSPREMPGELSIDGVTRLIAAHGAKAWEISRKVAGATGHAVAGIVVFVVVTYARLARGAEIYAWIERHLPVQSRHLARISAAFAETGRGLFVGLGGAALAQAVVATITYGIAGVPRAALLGVLTFFAALVPGIGSALVWAPLALALALTGRTGAAITVAVLGIAVIGTIDNVLKPFLTRYGRLRLPMSVVFVVLLGGLLVVGPAGVLLGPIVVRLATELIVMAREEREADVAPSAPPEPAPGPIALGSRAVEAVVAARAS